MKLKAILYSARVDRDGCWKITFEVPENDGKKAAALATQTQKVMDLDVEPENEN